LVNKWVENEKNKVEKSLQQVQVEVHRLYWLVKENDKQVVIVHQKLMVAKPKAKKLWTHAELWKVGARKNHLQLEFEEKNKEY